MAGRSIGELGETITRLTRKVEGDFSTRRLSSPTVDDEKSYGGLEGVVDPLVALELAEAARELASLAQGPRVALGVMGLQVHDSSSLGVIVAFDIPSLVPLGGGAVSYAELAGSSGLDEDRLKRVLRYAMTNYVFRESPRDQVRHTALSAHLARSPNFRDFLRTVSTVFNPANAALPLALRRFPQTRAMTRTAHNVARHTDRTFYEWLDGDGDDTGNGNGEGEGEGDGNLRDVFDRGMEGISRGGQRLQGTDLRAFPWRERLLRPGATVVDVGGSGGHFARDLAALHPALSVVVQDLPGVIEVAVRRQQQGRDGADVTYQAHSFFDEQPVRGADVYFLRHVFHNHPDDECVAILDALLPALQPGVSRVLVSEYVVPAEAGEEGDEGGGGRGLGIKSMRQMDLMTMALFNAKERTRAEYEVLFRRSSPRLKLCGTHQVADDPRSCIFEAVFES